mmetsp:Transcript_38585/g.49224  ORF Transcript_38585/g.49224 Transcript_38585/m.49224 type:complete len:147 (-) Transcript_38585:636-1076(-)
MVAFQLHIPKLQSHVSVGTKIELEPKRARFSKNPVSKVFLIQSFKNSEVHEKIWWSREDYFNFQQDAKEILERCLTEIKNMLTKRTRAHVTPTVHNRIPLSKRKIQFSQNEDSAKISTKKIKLQNPSNSRKLENSRLPLKKRRRPT